MRGVTDYHTPGSRRHHTREVYSKYPLNSARNVPSSRQARTTRRPEGEAVDDNQAATSRRPALFHPIWNDKTTRSPRCSGLAHE